jgi:hypothetical protein
MRLRVSALGDLPFNASEIFARVSGVCFFPGCHPAFAIAPPFMQINLLNASLQVDLHCWQPLFQFYFEATRRANSFERSVSLKDFVRSQQPRFQI